MLKLEQTEQNKKEGHILVGHFLRDDFKGAKEETGIARLIRIANELSVQFLVTFQSNTTGFLVIIVEQFFIGSIELPDGLVGHSVHAINSEFSESDGTVTVNINGLENAGYKGLKGRWKINICLSNTVTLDGFCEFVSANFIVLVEVSQFGNLVPQVSHDLLVLLECAFIPVTFAFNDGVANGQAFEVVLIQRTVAVDVVHVPDDELDAVIP